MNEQNKLRYEVYERKRDTFQSLLNTIEGGSRAGQITLLEQNSEWARSLGNISIALGAAISPILFATSENSQKWSEIPFYLGIFLLIGNGVWIYYNQKAEIEAGFNKLLWMGKEEEINLLKMVNLLNKVIFYQAKEYETNFLQFESVVQAKEAAAMSRPTESPKISIKSDLSLLFLVIGVYLIASRIWQFSQSLYILIGTTTLVVLILAIGVSVIFAIKHTKKAHKLTSAIAKERNDYMSWWRTRNGQGADE